MRPIFTSIFFLLLCCFLFAQTPPQAFNNKINKKTNQPTPHSCGANLMREQLLSNHPEIAKIIEKNQQIYYQNMINGVQYEKATVSIPTVVHIVHFNGTPVGSAENISDAMILQGLSNLNKCFSNTTPYNFGTGVDVEIQFCLAQRDINNSTAGFTNQGGTMAGVTRHASSTYTDLDMDTEDTGLKALSQGPPNLFPSNKYMNIWVVDEICSSIASDCSVAGYAYFSASHGMPEDGLVVEALTWSGSTDDIKIASHEIGHYFDLEHTFEGGCPNNNCLTSGDFVCDTNPDNSQSFVACSSVPNSCNTDDDDLSTNNPFRPIGNGGIGDQVDPYENYMDYGFQNCQKRFTPGQKARMLNTLNTTRASLITSIGCVPLSAVDAGIETIVSPVGSICTSPFTPVVTIRNYGTSTLTTMQIKVEVDNVLQYTYNWTGSIPTNTVSSNVNLNPLTVALGTHTIKIYTASPNGSVDGFPSNDFKTATLSYGSGLALPYTENFEGVNSLTIINPNSIFSPNLAWTLVNAPATCTSKTGNKVMYMDFFDYPVQGDKDHLTTPTISLSGVTMANLTFDLAYVPYGPTNEDSLAIYVSTDCGATFPNRVYYDGGLTMATNGGSYVPGITEWAPSGCSDWEKITVNLSAFAGQNVVLQFTATNRYGNNLYLDNINLTGSSGIVVKSTVFLEGVTTGTAMNTTLTSAIPLTQPFGSSAWAYSGTESISSVPVNMVDWVLVQLRNTTATIGDNVVETKAALLYNDGTIHDVSGSLGVLFNSAPGNYYITIAALGYLPVISANTVSLPNATAYDFTTTASQTYSPLQTKLVLGKYCLIAGDANNDGKITFADYNSLYAAYLLGGTNVYSSADLNRDKTVSVADYTLFKSNTAVFTIQPLRH